MSETKKEKKATVTFARTQISLPLTSHTTSPIWLEMKPAESPSERGEEIKVFRSLDSA